jgi:DNA invertase Pin-like site-specific DNA recombinase
MQRLKRDVEADVRHVDEKPAVTRIGYVRVSTVTQTLDQQELALDAAGVSKTFSDTMSGARYDRPGLAALLEYARDGDTVVVWKLDRLGRNTLHILETVKALTGRGVTLVSITDGIDSSTPAGRMMIGVLGSLAEYERELTKERTALKRQASRANGTKLGRPRKVVRPPRRRPLTHRCPPVCPVTSGPVRAARGSGRGRPALRGRR